MFAKFLGIFDIAISHLRLPEVFCIICQKGLCRYPEAIMFPLPLYRFEHEVLELELAAGLSSLKLLHNSIDDICFLPAAYMFEFVAVL